MVMRRSNDLLKSKFRTGRCEMCARSGCRLEYHHIRYSPEIVIGLCHNCHFRVHYMKQSLSESELYKLLSRLYRPETMQKYKGRLHELLNLSHTLTHTLSPQEEKGIAPSRREYLKARENGEASKEKQES